VFSVCPASIPYAHALIDLFGMEGEPFKENICSNINRLLEAQERKSVRLLFALFCNVLRGYPPQLGLLVFLCRLSSAAQLILFLLSTSGFFWNRWLF